MNTPRNGTMITKIVHRTFEPPPMSFRRKRSAKTVIRIQNQITQAKKMSIVQRTSRNG
jgi:hypothetical protein